MDSPSLPLPSMDLQMHNPKPVLDSLNTRYMTTWKLDDLSLVISFCLRHLPPAEEQGSIDPYVVEDLRLGLVQGLYARYRHTKDMDDLKMVIKMCQDTLTQITNARQKHIFVSLQGTALLDQFIREKSESSLQRSLELHIQALGMGKGTPSERANILGELSLSYFYDFRARGNPHHLELAVVFAQESLQLRSQNDPQRHQSLISLTLALRTRYNATGKVEDIEAALKHSLEALELCRQGHRDRSSILHLTARAYFRLYKDTGDTVHLMSAISLERDGLRGHPAEMQHGKHFALTSLGISLLTRAVDFGQLQDIDEAIELFHEAVRRCGRGIWPYHELAHYLAVCLRHRYQFRGSLCDLEEALELQKSLKFDDTLPSANSLSQADTSQLPSGAQIKPAPARLYLTLHELAASLRLHSIITSDQTEMSESLSIHCRAVTLLPKGHTDRALCLFGLSLAYLNSGNNQSTTFQAFQAFTEAVTDPHRSVQLRLAEALEVLEEVETVTQHPDCSDDTRCMAVSAYRQTIRLLPRVALFGDQVRLRLRILARSAHLSANAARQAVLLGDFSSAIEMLEEGRATFWQHHLKLRVSYRTLPAFLAGRLSDLARDLRSSTAFCLSQPSLLAVPSARQLEADFEALLEVTRSLPGLSRFLLHEPYQAISQVASHGPVVILIPGPMSCHALIVPQCGGTPKHVALDFTESRLKFLNNRLRSVGQCRKRFAGNFTAQRATKILIQNEGTAEAILNELWNKLVKPIIHALGWEQVTDNLRRRLWWCATGIFAFLPVHAASDLNASRRLLDGQSSDYLVSSYTPTITALLNARKGQSTITWTDACILLAGAPTPYCGTRLHHVVTEIETARNELSKALNPNVHSGSPAFIKVLQDARAPDVLDALPTAALLHLACHGVQDTQDPLSSGFLMSDCLLKVTDLLELNLTGAFVAVLSACESAQGDVKHPDQAVHLAASLLFAGFRSVVGTMWSMQDDDGPLIARKFYTELFRNGKDSVGADSVAYALHAAVGELRRMKMPPSRWAPYIHIGI